MEKKYKITYELTYEGGSTSRHITTANMVENSVTEALTKIATSKNINPYVKDITVLEIIED